MCRPAFALLVVLGVLCQDRGFAQPAKEKPRSVAGVWQGTLKLGKAEVRLILELKPKGEGFAGLMDSPDQGVFGLPIDGADVKDGTFTMSMKKLGASFEGKLDGAGNQIVGTWKQGVQLPLTFERLDKKPEYARPQDPKKPYPYKEEEVVYENAKAKIKLAATLTIPEGKGPFPAVLLLTGSGPQDRNESLLGHRPFLVLADYLTRKGIAVLRADDRGVGKSTGQFLGATTADFVDDALAGVAFLKTRAEINPKKIGLVGHSEGGLVAPLAAVASPDVAFIVLLAGPGLPGDEIIMQQVVRALKARGATKEFQEWSVSLQRRLMDTLKQEGDDEAAHKRMQAVLKEYLAKLPAEEAKKVEESVNAQLARQHLAWTRYFLRLDPRLALKKVQVPVLAICGELDVQVLARDNLPEIDKALKEGGNKDYTVKEFAGLNHLFQTAKTGAVAEYGMIQETLAPVVLEFVSDWILKRVR